MAWKGDLAKVQQRSASARLMSKTTEQDDATESPRRTKPVFEDDVDFEHPERELFIWAILFNCRELAHLFWRSGKDHLGGALFASALLYRLSELAGNEEEAELSADLAMRSDECEQWAISVLSECYSRDKQLTHRLLVRELDHWGDTTLFRLANSFALMKFSGQSACQTKLNSIWKGRIAVYTSETKIFFCTFLPFLIPFLKYTTVDAIDLEEEEEEGVLDGSPRSAPVAFNRVTPETLPDSDGDGLGFVPSSARQDTQVLAARLKRVNLFDFSTDNVNIFSAIYYFYQTPVTKFFSNLVAYLVFMCLFSYVILVELGPIGKENSPSTAEYFTWAWCATLIIEECRQVFAREHKSLKYKIRDWFASFWICFDAIIYLFFLISITLRYTVSNENFEIARVMYSITLAMFYLRSMQYFYAEKNLGPKIIMIRKMLKDLLFFFLILMVFMVSFGTAYHANLFPQSPASFSLLANIVYYPYFQIYGEIFLDEMKGDGDSSCTKNETIWRDNIFKRCPAENTVVPTMLALYMIITQVLLLNLLIAMFSYTFQTVQENSTQVWRYYRLSLIFEYYNRPALFPPLIFFTHVYRLFRWVRHRIRDKGQGTNALCLRLSESEQMRLTLFEKNAMETFLSLSKEKSKSTLDNRVTRTAKRLENVMEELERIREFLKPSNTTKTSLTLPVQFDPDSEATQSKLQRERELMERPSLSAGSSSKKSKVDPPRVQALSNKVDGVITQTAAMSQRLNQLALLLEASLASKKESTN